MVEERIEHLAVQEPLQDASTTDLSTWCITSGGMTVTNQAARDGVVGNFRALQLYNHGRYLDSRGIEEFEDFYTRIAGNDIFC